MNDPWLILLGRYFVAIVVVVLIVPLGGGGILWKSFQIAGIGNVTWRQCWRAYFLACLYAYAIALGLNLTLRSRILALGAFCAIPLVVVVLASVLRPVDSGWSTLGRLVFTFFAPFARCPSR